jgi:hypothetical protein
MFTVRWSVLRAAARAAWPVWVAVLGVAVAVTLAAATGWARSSTPATVIQDAGVILELLGVSTVLYGITESRRRFKRPSIRASLSGWLKFVARAFERPRDVTIHVPTIQSTVTMGTPTVRIGLTSTATVEERVGALERGLTELKTETTSATDGLRRDVRTLTRDLQREREAREAGEKRALLEVEDLAVGGIPVEAVGLFWTVAGIIFTSDIGEWAGRLLTR